MRLPILFATTILFSAPAWSAEQGTYRPGQSYYSIHAQSPGQCEQQCLGDAQCKVWNFVRVQTSPTGAVCEFKARISQPISSPISISGESPSAFDSMKIIQAGLRTIRVGQPPATVPPRTYAAKQQISRQNRLNPTIKVGAVPRPQINQSRQILSRPPPQNQQMAYAPVRAPIAAPSGPHQQYASYQNRPQSINDQLSNLDPAPEQKRLPLAQPTSIIRHNLGTPEYQASRAAQPKFRPHLDAQSLPPTQPQPMRNPISRPEPSQTPSFIEPSLSAASQLSSQIIEPRIDPGLAGAPVTAQPSRNALYGSLFDDVKTPRTLQKSDVNLDPEAPIPTVSSVPVSNIDQSPL